MNNKILITILITVCSCTKKQIIENNSKRVIGKYKNYRVDIYLQITDSTWSTNGFVNGKILHISDTALHCRTTYEQYNYNYNIPYYFKKDTLMMWNGINNNKFLKFDIIWSLVVYDNTNTPLLGLLNVAIGGGVYFIGKLVSEKKTK